MDVGDPSGSMTHVYLMEVADEQGDRLASANNERDDGRVMVLTASPVILTLGTARATRLMGTLSESVE